MSGIKDYSGSAFFSQRFIANITLTPNTNNLGSAHLKRVAQTMKTDEVAHAIDISIFCMYAEALVANALPKLVQ